MSRLHNLQYENCTRCRLHESRRRLVFGGYGQCSRGTVEREGKLLYYEGDIEKGDEDGFLEIIWPKLLFIGEAPEVVEDITGTPLVGQSGRIFNCCLSHTTTEFYFEITNVVACRPPENRQPKETEIKQCLPRIPLQAYQGVILLGKLAETYIKVPNSLKLPHPSTILRMEYKLGTIKEVARDIDIYVKSICYSRNENPNGSPRN